MRGAGRALGGRGGDGRRSVRGQVREGAPGPPGGSSPSRPGASGWKFRSCCAVQAWGCTAAVLPLQPSTAPPQPSPPPRGWRRVQPAVLPVLQAAGWDPALSQAHCSQICGPRRARRASHRCPRNTLCAAWCKQRLAPALNKLVVYERCVFLWVVPCRRVLFCLLVSSPQKNNPTCLKSRDFRQRSCNHVNVCKCIRIYSSTGTSSSSFTSSRT